MAAHGALSATLWCRILPGGSYALPGSVIWRSIAPFVGPRKLAPPGSHCACRCAAPAGGRRLAPRILPVAGPATPAGRHGLGVIFITHRAQGQHLQHRQAVRLPLMQVSQQQLAHPNLAAISRPHQRAGVIESRRRVVPDRACARPKAPIAVSPSFNNRPSRPSSQPARSFGVSCGGCAGRRSSASSSIRSGAAVGSLTCCNSAGKCRSACCQSST
ncbi:hypothetical protein BANRA_00002 [Klebsiella pneumoniae]|nr:hypothetical protein BANRA_00002 [Klebsiella pneumoniae]